MCLDNSLLSSLFILDALWLLGKTYEEDEGDMEEPETSTLEQAKFDWAHFWMEEGGSPALAESQAQRLIIQVFGLSDPSSLFVLFSTLSLCVGP